MDFTPLAGELNNQVSQMVSLNPLFESQTGQVRVFLNTTLPDATIAEIQGAIVAAGGQLVQSVYQAARCLFITFRGQSLTAIADSVTPLAASIIGWQVLREVTDTGNAIWWVAGTGIAVIALWKWARARKKRK